MDRQAWIAELRTNVKTTYDAEAADYDANLYPADVQRAFVSRLLDTCAPGGLVLDAPCGTGRYFEQVAAAGRRVVGIDQSAGMLEAAGRRGVAVSLHHVGLQELDFTDVFDASMTIDALENVAPEDWPTVLANLHRAVRPRGHLYLTVEETEQAVIDSAFDSLVVRGLPAVRGEVVDGDTAGYHYYPGRARVFAWLAAEGLEVVDEAYDQQDGWGYRHLLLRTG
jgi:ubiquinone/menaquinone biosynthesis C-methylase UbiE